MAMLPKPSCCICHRSNCECNAIRPILGHMGEYLKKITQKSEPMKIDALSDNVTDPFRNYRIKKYYESNDHLLLHVYYGDTKSYESDKYLVYKDITFNEVYKWDRIDPHFCNNPEHPSPIARFEPTYDGWINAVEFIQSRR